MTIHSRRERRFAVCRFVFPLALCLASPSAASAAADQVIDQMKTFTVMYGRAIGCGLSGLETIGHQIGRWMDKKFPAGSPDQITYLPVFMEGVRTSAEAQHDGKSPDTCASVASFFSSPEFSALLKR